MSSKSKFLISVIIPTYNLEKYICDGLEALRTQTLPQELFEVIVIDDGSIDRTLSLVQNFKGILNLRTRKLDKNGGPGIARNHGIQEARGEYIFFLDGDDSLVPQGLELLHDVIREKRPDLITFDWSHPAERDPHGEYLPKRKDLADMPVEREALITHYLGMNMDGSVIYTLAKKALFDDYQIRFPGGLHEDMSVIFMMYFAAPSICKIPHVIYLKRNRDDSIINTFTEKHVDGYLSAWPAIMEFLRENKGNEALDGYLPSYFRGMSGLICTLIIKNFKVHGENFYQRMDIYDRIMGKLAQDKWLNFPDISCFPDKSRKDQITRLFFSHMLRPDRSTSPEDKVRSFEQAYRSAPHGNG